MTLSRFLISLLVLCVPGQTAIAQEEIDSINPATVTDGPYISWQGDSLLAVSYICFGEHHEQTVAIDSVADIPECCFPTLPGGLTVSREPIVHNQYRFENVSRIMAISDIHGEYEAMIDFLQTTNVIDSNLNWQWDVGHLVIVGDVFDRGDMVLRSLWFLYRLQQQALKAGGAVHYLRGNHELMVLRGYEHYLHPKYTQVTVPQIGTPHYDLIGPNTILGQWLRDRPTMIVIDSILFVHGGASLDLTRTNLTLPEINAAARAYLDLPQDSVKADSLASFLYGKMGPFWYRGLLIEYNYPQITKPELDSVLAYFEARAIVVGHSEMDSLTSMFDAHLFGVDVPVDELGGLQGWLLQDQIFYRVTTKGVLQRLGHIDRTPPGPPGMLH